MRQDSELLRLFADYFRLWCNEGNVVVRQKSVGYGLCVVHKVWSILTYRSGKVSSEESIRVLAIINREKPKDFNKFKPYWWPVEDNDVRQMFLDRLVEKYKLKEARDERTD